MNEVKVRVADVRERIAYNREQHRAVFEKALGVYRERVVELLERRLEAARKGQKVNHFIELPQPEDHTGDYDRVLDMLDMCVEDTVTLSARDFDRYVRDRWEWADSFAANTTSYLQQ